MPTILITGATGSIGTALCQHLAGAGHHLILTARNSERLTTLAACLRADYKIKVDYATTDFAAASFTALTQFAPSGLDGIVLMPPPPMQAIDCLPADAVWEDIFQRSFIGPTALLRTLMPALCSRQGALVLISGICAKQPLPNYATNNALKMAWVGQLKSLADHYGPTGVRCNAVALGGIISTKFMQKIAAEAAATNLSRATLLKARFANVPLRRYAELTEVAAMIEFLLTSPARPASYGANTCLRRRLHARLLIFASLQPLNERI